MKTITAKELRQNAGEILHSVHMLGEEYFVTMSGKPVAKLVPLDGIPIGSSAPTAPERAEMALACPPDGSAD